MSANISANLTRATTFSRFAWAQLPRGPLLVFNGENAFKLFEIEQFEEIPLPDSDRRQPLSAGPLFWAGPTGRVFGYTGNYGQPNGIGVIAPCSTAKSNRGASTKAHGS